MARLERDFPDEVSKVTNFRNIIDFRNILAHGYDIIDDAIVWDIIRHHLPVLKDEVTNLFDI